MKQSRYSILLAQDQYPDSLDAIFTKLSLPTTLQNTMIDAVAMAEKPV